MGNKRFWSLLLVLLMLCAPLTARAEGGAESFDPFGRYDEPITLTVGRPLDPMLKYPEGETPEDNQYTRYIKEQLNIDVKVMWSAAGGSDYQQKVNLAIASDDLPDAMEIEYTPFINTVRSEQIQPLTDVIEKYASPVLKEYFASGEGRSEQAVTFDGQMMALPNMAVQASGVHGMWIRQDWLDKLGLQPPKTLDELAEVAKAFMEKDPGGNGAGNTIGIAGPGKNNKLYANFLVSGNNTYGFDPLFGAHKAYPGYWLKGEGGNAVYGSILPETKEVLATLRQMYADGLIDPEIGIRDNTQELVKAGKAGIFFGPWHAPYNWVDVVQADPTVNWQAYLLPLDGDGEYNAHMNAVSFYFTVVRKDYEHPEAIVKLANLLIRDESTFDVKRLPASEYPLRYLGARAPRDECEYEVAAIRDVLSGKKTLESFTENELATYKLMRADITNIQKIKKEPYDDMSIGTWDVAADPNNWGRLYALMVGCSPLVDVNYNKVYSEIYAQTELMEMRWANLKKLEDEAFLKIIMGIEPVESFERFVEEWKRIGGDEITEEVTAVMQK